jgi:hypothetical protein
VNDAPIISVIERRKNMKVNEGVLDRLIRIILALLIIVLFFAGALPGYWALLLIISGALLVTGFTGYCLLYRILGINTGKKA